MTSLQTMNEGGGQKPLHPVQLQLKITPSKIGLIEKSNWFRGKKLSQKLKYLNLRCEQSER